MTLADPPVLEEAPPDPDTAKQRVEELLKTKDAPIGAEPREDALDDPALTAPPEHTSGGGGNG